MTDPSKNWRDWRDAIRWAACSSEGKVAAVLTEALLEAEEEREKTHDLIEAVCEKHGIPTGPTPMASLRKLLFSKKRRSKGDMSNYDGTPAHEQRLRAERDAALEKLDECEGIMRALASSLSAGGYNAPTFDPKVFGEKIRWGIDEHADMQVTLAHDKLIAERDAAVAEAAELRHSVDMLLRMVAMVHERDLGGMIVDPYGVIGDALESIDQPRTPDSWRALSIYAHGYDCGEQKPEDVAPSPIQQELSDAIDALHAAGILTFGTLAQGVEKLAVMRDNLAAQIDEATKGLEAAGVETLGTVALGVEKLAGERDAALAELIDERERAYNEACAKCEETERALAKTCGAMQDEIDNPMIGGYYQQGVFECKALMMANGLWRDPAPARADESGGGSA